nr:hypothetical protein [uncultured Lachnoclostridium sp.]
MDSIHKCIRFAVRKPSAGFFLFWRKIKKKGFDEDEKQETADPGLGPDSGTGGKCAGVGGAYPG